MGTSKTAPWVFGTAILAVLMLIGAWFLAISPKLSAAADESDQTQAQQARVDQLQIQLAGLKHDFENIESFRTQLQDLQVQIPTDQQLSTLLRQVSTIATETSIVLTSVTASSPAAVVGTASADSATAAAPAAAAATAPAPAQAVTGFYAIPIEVVVVGTYPNTVAFLDKLQTGNPRLILVSRIDLVRQEVTGAQGGVPALAAGDIQLTFTAYAFAMPDARQPVVAPTPAPLPEPAAQPNPFLPLQ
jgi:Tfp pilus assembly protein PilO